VPDRLDEKEWLETSDAALYLGMTEHWIRRQISAKSIPYSKIGNRIRFRRTDLNALLAEGDVEAVN
jgi:excisionase family DNA binding protein